MVKKTYYNRDYKAKQVTLVWACTENGTKQNSQKRINLLTPSGFFTFQQV